MQKQYVWTLMSDRLQKEMFRDIFLIKQQDSEVPKLLVVYSDVSVVTSFLIQPSTLSHCHTKIGFNHITDRTHVHE